MAIDLTWKASLGLVLVACEPASFDPVVRGSGSTVAAPSHDQGVGGNNEGGAANESVLETQPSSAPSSAPVGGGPNPSTIDPPPTSSSECPVPMNTYWVESTTNDCGIRGAWFAYSDCNSSPGTEASPPDCTRLDQYAQAPNPLGNANGQMCIKGRTVKIGSDYAHKWGAGIGLNLNQLDGDSPKNPIRELPVAIQGFSFKLIANYLEKKIRVYFPTALTKDKAHYVEVDPSTGVFTVRFTEAVQDPPQTELIPGDVVAIQFQIPGEKDREMDFDYCIEDLRALY